MKKLLCLIILIISCSFFIFSETIICPHCGESFEYTRSISDNTKNDYKIINYDTFEVFYYNNKDRIGSKICFKNVKIYNFYSGNRMNIAFNGGSVNVYVRSDEVIMELMDHKGEYIDFYGITTDFSNLAFCELESFEFVK